MITVDLRYPRVAKRVYVKVAHRQKLFYLQIYLWRRAHKSTDKFEHGSSNDEAETKEIITLTLKVGSIIECLNTYTHNIICSANVTRFAFEFVLHHLTNKWRIYERLLRNTTFLNPFHPHLLFSQTFYRFNVKLTFFLFLIAKFYL